MGQVWSWFLQLLGLLLSHLPSPHSSFNHLDIMATPIKIQTFRGQIFQQIRDEHLKNGTLFTDAEFSKAVAIDAYVSPEDGDNEIQDDDEFMRPKDIVKNPKFFVKGASRFDVIQGYPMDCWFASSLASLTLNRKLFQNVVPDENSFDKKCAGVFHFRFWQYGTWTDVVVDDRLPVFYKKMENMKSSENNEFWSALLEKAYAKVKKNYKVLNGGEPEEALVDFTGGITVTHFLNQSTPPEELFLTMQKASADGDLMTADIYPDDSWTEDTAGLQQGHGYSITKVVFLEFQNNNQTISERLVRVRNPYGVRNGEWAGDWGDESEKWKTVPKKVLQDLEVTATSDGEFWITFNDYYKYFTLMMILYVPIPATVEGDTIKLDDEKWKLESHHGSWAVCESCMRPAIGGSHESGLFHKNPQYRFTVANFSEQNAFLGVMQKYRRENGKAMLPIGVSIYKVPENAPANLSAEFFAENKPVGTVEDPVNGMREASGVFSLQRGQYCAVPYTFLVVDGNRTLPSENVEFMLRIFLKK